jgi:hypothetical protein
VLTVEPTSHANLELSQLAFQGRPRLSCNSHNTAFVTFLREILCSTKKVQHVFALSVLVFDAEANEKNPPVPMYNRIL